MKLADPARMSVGGEFANRLQRAIGHLQALNTPEMRRELTAPDATWHWGADYMGRWLGSMALLSRHTRHDYGCQAVARELIACQRPDGSFGAFGDDHDYQEWFGMGRGLVGLLDYYTASGAGAALEAAVRLGDYYVASYPQAADFMRECYASGLEGLVHLARVTGQARYRRTAEQMAEASPAYQQQWYSVTLGARGRRAPCGGHVHCQLTTARGLLDLHELTGEPRFRDAAHRLHEYIVAEALWISGGVGFYFNRPEENEACADADWVRLNLQFWRLSGDPRYLDLAEQALVNQLYFAQIDSGAFCYLRGLQNRAGAVFDVCCSHHGPRAMWEVMRHAFTTGPDGVSANLLLDASVQLALDGSPPSELSLDSSVSYETEAVFWTLTLNDLPPSLFPLHLRIPGWAGQAAVTVNGQPATGASSPGRLRLERTWRAGDRVVVRLPRRVAVRRGHTLGRHVLNPNEVAVFYGPHLYGVSDRHNPAVSLHLMRVAWSAATQASDFVAEASNRLEAWGLDPAGRKTRLVLSPLYEVGGVANGAGRSHPVSTSPFRVWLPLVLASAV